MGPTMGMSADADPCVHEKSPPVGSAANNPVTQPTGIKIVPATTRQESRQASGRGCRKPPASSLAVARRRSRARREREPRSARSPAAEAPPVTAKAEARAEAAAPYPSVRAEAGPAGCTPCRPSAFLADTAACRSRRPCPCPKLARASSSDRRSHRRPTCRQHKALTRARHAQGMRASPQARSKRREERRAMDASPRRPTWQGPAELIK